MKMKFIKTRKKYRIVFLVVLLLTAVNAQKVTVDCSQPVYPPILNKWGYNSYWSTNGNAEYEEVELAGSCNMQMAAGLVEVTLQEKGEKIPKIFTRPDLKDIKVNLQPDYQQLRKVLKKNNILQFTQFCGTPMEMFESPKYTNPGLNSYPNIFPKMLYDYYKRNTISTSKNDYKYRWSSTFGGGGNSYPLPDHDGMIEYAEAWAEYAEKMYAEDKQPQIFAFWQEITHTIVSKEGVEADGARQGQIVNMNAFLDFYTKVGPAIKARNPDFMMAGFQLNDNNAAQLKATLEDGSKGTWGEWVIEELLRREAKAGKRFPIDFFSIQCFADHNTPTIITRMRMGLREKRFNKVPIVINRYKQDNLQKNIDIFLNTPEISHVLWSNWKGIGSNSELVKTIKRISEMEPPRKDVRTSGNVQAYASGDRKHLSVLLFGKGNVALDIVNIPDDLIGRNSTVKVVSVENKTEEIVQVSGNRFSRNIPVDGIELVRITGPEEYHRQKEDFALEKATYAKHEVWVDREDDPAVKPKGLGHFSMHKNTLITATGASGNSVIGLAGVVLRDLPNRDYAVNAKIDAFDLPGKNPDTKICVRLDYLNRESVLKTVVYYDSDYGSSGFFYNIDWMQEKEVTLIGVKFITAKELLVDVHAHAPSVWAKADNGARRVMVSLLLRNAKNGSILTAGLSDGTTRINSGFESLRKKDNNIARIYQNSITKQIVIKVPGNNIKSRIGLYTTQGRNVYEQYTKGETHILNTSHLARGVYLLKIGNTMTCINERIIIE